MKTVLWISRHDMTGEQLADLERIAGGPVGLLRWTDTVRDVTVLEPLVRQADIVAAVLPLELMARLADMTAGVPLIQSVSDRIPTGRTYTAPDGRTEREFAFRHRAWQLIERIEIKTRLL